VHALAPQQRRIAAVAERHSGRAPQADDANAQQVERKRPSDPTALTA
jgi:hypothetical protein